MGSKESMQDFYKEMLDLGVFNSNTKIGEFESLFKDALAGGAYGKNALSWAQNLQNSFAGKVYQGSDDVWKAYSYQMELGRLTDAFKKSPTNIPVTDARNIIDLQQSGLTPSQLTGRST